LRKRTRCVNAAAKWVTSVRIDRLSAHPYHHRPSVSRSNMFAIVSDIHANLEAFSAVLTEIDRRGIKDILCLGDVVGYGPNPMECLDLVRQRCKISLMGNHDFAVFYEPFNFNSGAESACYWT